MTSFGQILDTLLTENKIGRSVFARRINITKSQLAGIISGKQIPDSELMERMKLALEIDAIGCMLLLETYKVVSTLRSKYV